MSPIPSRTLSRGHIDDVRLDAMPELEIGVALQVLAAGDQSELQGAEQHFLRLGDERPATVRVTPALPIAVLDPRGRVLREGRGVLDVAPTDPSGSVISVLVPGATDRVVAFAVRLERAGRSVGRAPPPEEPTARREAEPPSEPPPRRPDPYASPSGAPARGVTVRGVALDSVNGRPVPGFFVVGRPGTDLAGAVALLQMGKLGSDEFDSQLAAGARCDMNGRFVVQELDRGAAYPAGVVAPGYRPTYGAVRLGPNHPPVLDLGVVHMVR